MMDNDEIRQKVDRAYHCSCSEKKLRYKLNKTGTKMFYLQCVRCGDYARLPKDKVASPNSSLIQPLDEELRRSWWNNRSEYFSKLYQEAKNQERQEWLDWYNKYLASPQWAKKRDVVLKRDNYLCQGCLVNRATQVHHLTYDRAGNEMLFDLISICNKCHDEIHGSTSER